MSYPSNNEDTVMFQFQLEDTVLVVKRCTALLTNSLVLASGLNDMAPVDLKNDLFSRSSDGLIQRSDFHQFIITRGNLNKQQHTGLVAILLAIFTSLDRTNSGCVDVVELVCSLIVLCEGNKSQKLAFAFELIDEDKDGLLSRRDLWRFFRSFLCTLITLCKSNIDNAVPAGADVLDSLAVWTASRLLAWDESSQTSFEDLADWYTYTGHNVASFIELLDLRKWLPAYHSPPTRTPPLPSDQFHIELAFGLQLSFEEKHGVFIHHLASHAGLIEVDPFDLTKLLSRWCDDHGYLSKYNFIHNVMSSVCSRKGQLDYTMGMLIRLFTFLDTEHEDMVELPLIATALSVLCAGSKSHKLNLGFQIWDSDSTGSISRSSLTMLLYSYLVMFYFVSVQGQVTAASGSIHSHLLEGCNAFTKTITVAAQGISFESFGTWYNGTGFQTMPWIELINLQKWNYAFVNDTNHAKERDEEDDEEEEEDEEDDPSTSDETEAFTIVLYTHHSSSNASYLRVSKGTSQRYCSITKDVNLPGDIVTIFFDGAEDGLIGESAFDDISRTVFSAINKSELRSSLNLNRFFNAFDRAGEGSAVDVVELAIGFTIFLEGSKSSKLALAFDLLDDDKDGLLSRRDVWRFFRSFLCGLLFVTGFMSSHEHDIKFLLDASCVWLCDSLFSSIPDDRNVAYFDDIADWYSGNGFKVASWLELLDKKKWVILSQ